MHNEPIHLPWEAPDWFEQVSAWIESQIQGHGWRITAPIEMIHQRPWSSLARVTTDHGVAYFKAPAPMFSYEAGLTQALADWRPDCSLPLLGLDLEQGWILSADAGMTLRQVTRSPDQIPHWLRVMPLYAELQIELIDRVPELLALGLPDRRLEQLPQSYARVLEDTENLRIGLEDGLKPEEYQRLRDGQTHFATQCEQLAAYNLPSTLSHEEVHENNVLFGDGRYIFIDWSDCSVGHPFFTMLVTLRAAAHWLKLDETGPELRQVRDAYLEPWTKFAPRDELLQALALAYRLGMVNRALSWHHGLARLSERDKAEYADSVPGWLQDYLQAEAESGSI